MIGVYRVLQNYIIRKLFYILLFAFVIAPFTRGEDINFERITTENGLSQSWVTAILQDELGFIWIGTKDGLNCFDGYSFKVYRFEENNPNSLSNNTINDLLEDENGNIWVCTSNGVNVYIRNKDWFEQFQNIPALDVLCVLKDKYHCFWFGTAEGLYWIDPSSSLIEFIQTDPADSNSISDNMINCLYEDSDGNIWAGTNNGLNLFNNNLKEWFRFQKSITPNTISGSIINTITEDHTGRIWIGSSDGGLDVIIDPDEIPSEIKFSHYLSGSVMHLLPDTRGNLWVGHHAVLGMDLISFSGFNESSSEIIHFENNPEVETSLSDNSVYTLYEDRSGDIWVGTYGKGLNYYSPRSKKFQSVRHIPNVVNSLGSNVVNCFLEESNYLWIGTEHGLNRYDKETGRYKLFKFQSNDPMSIGSNAIYSLFKDSKGNLWVGTWAGGLNRYNYKFENFTRYQVNEDEAGISSNNIFSILEDHRGYLWIGTIGGGLNRFDYSTGKFKHYLQDLSESNSLHDNYVNAIYQTQDNNLWISTYNTLNKFDYQTESFTYYSRELYQGSGMKMADLLVIFEDSGNNLWLGTESGLIYFDRESQSFKQYTTANGMPNNYVKSILEDSSGNLWIGSNKGLIKFINGINLPDTSEFRSYIAKDGIQGNEFIKRSAYMNKEGLMYFGGTNGYTFFKPEQIIDSQEKPRVVLTEFLIFNKPVKAYSNSSPLKEDITVATDITLNHKHSVISFRYSSMSFLNSEKTMYKYMLEGFDKDWNFVGTQRIASYTNLNSGDYVFKVSASNSDGIWNDNVTSIELRINPPWYRTALFIISASVFVILLLLIIYKLRIAGLQRQKMYLEKKIRERTISLSETNMLLNEKQKEVTSKNKELEMHQNNLENLVKVRTAELEMAKEKAEESDRLKSAFLANMSHEIRTPMNAIVGFASLLKEPHIKKSERNLYIDTINRNSESLLVLINDMLEVSLIEAGQITMVESSFEVDTIFKELEAFYNISNEKKLQIKFVPGQIQNLILLTDPVRFRQVLSNLITNAIKYTEKGSVAFGYRIKKEEIEFYIADTGIGIQQSEFKNIFDHFHKIDDPDSHYYRGAGIGLSICKSLVQLMGGNIFLESIPGKGSTFYFTLPIRCRIDPVNEKKIIPANQKIESLANFNILIAEDDPTNYFLMEKILSKANARLTWARNGQEAVDYVQKSENPQEIIVLMDIKMPEMDGKEAFKLIRKLHPSIPVMAITAYAHQKEQKEIRQLNFDDYLIKPIKKAELLHAVQKLTKRN